MSGGFPIPGEVCACSTAGVSTSTSVGVSVTSGTSANTLGSWAQLTASLSIDACFGILIAGPAANGNANYQIDIGVGASGSEQAVASMILIGGTTALAYLPFPVSIPAGTRVAVRCSADNFGPFTISDVSCLFFDGAFASEGVKGIENVTGTPCGETSLTPSATANTMGSYSQIVSSTAKDYCGLTIACALAGGAGNPSHFLLDIAVGAGGSEQDIISNLPLIGTNFSTNLPMYLSLIPISIPAGTRLAARIQEDNTNANVQVLFVMGAYQ